MPCQMCLPRRCRNNNSTSRNTPQDHLQSVSRSLYPPWSSTVLYLTDQVPWLDPLKGGLVQSNTLIYPVPVLPHFHFRYRRRLVHFQNSLGPTCALLPNILLFTLGANTFSSFLVLPFCFQHIPSALPLSNIFIVILLHYTLLLFLFI